MFEGMEALRSLKESSIRGIGAGFVCSWPFFELKVRICLTRSLPRLPALKMASRLCLKASLSGGASSRANQRFR